MAKAVALDPAATKLSLGGDRAPERYADAQLAGLAALTRLEHVWLGKQRITRLPPLPPTVTRLSLTRCPSLGSLAGIESLVRLQHLTLLDLPALDLDAAMALLAELPELSELELGGRTLRAVPASIAKLPSVVDLTLAEAFHVDTATACKHLAKLTTLRNLHLVGAGDPPATLGLVTQLELLEIRGTAKALPRSIGQLRSLRELLLAFVPLATLPDELCDCARLEVLDVQHTKLQRLPAGLGQLGKLRVLRTSGSKLRELPASIGTLANLRELSLPSTIKPSALLLTLRQLRLETFHGPPELAAQLAITPPDVFDGDHLVLSPGDHIPAAFDPKRLTIRLPEHTAPLPQLSKLRALEQLTLDLDSLDDALARLATAPRLRELVIEGAHETLPATLGALVQVRDLRLETPSLKRLPDAIGELASLETLSIEHALITQLPAGLAKLRLRSLALRGCEQLATIPAMLDVAELVIRTGAQLDLTPLSTWPLRRLELSGPFTADVVLLDALEELDLRGTETTRLPAAIGKLAHLRRLDLRGLAIEALPPELAACTKLVWFGVPRLPGNVDVKRLLPRGRWKKTERNHTTFYERTDA